MKNRTIKAGRLFIHKNGIRAGVTVFLLTLLAACGADDNTPDMPQGDIPLDFGVSVDQSRQPCGRDYCFQPFLHGGVCLLYRQQQSEHFGQAQLHVQPKGGANQQCISLDVLTREVLVPIIRQIK
ncbi:hypothetical protein NXV81_27900 [Bacteroides ovatus]|nr:hypothetical protein [Bacteroides ovatus]